MREGGTAHAFAIKRQQVIADLATRLNLYVRPDCVDLTLGIVHCGTIKLLMVAVNGWSNLPPAYKLYGVCPNCGQECWSDGIDDWPVLVACIDHFVPGALHRRFCGTPASHHEIARYALYGERKRYEWPKHETE